MAKLPIELRSLARGQTVEMLKVLVGIAKSKTAPEGARVVAANSVLDRGWGKADQNQRVVGDDGGPIRVIIRQLIDNVDETAPIVIEHLSDRDS